MTLRRQSRLATTLGAIMLVTWPLAAQSPGGSAQVRAWHRAHALEILREFRDFLALPNVASDDGQIRRAAESALAMLSRRGVQTRLLESPGSPPAVYGELLTPGATRTVVLYAHYDGQPVQPRDWTTAGPFTPELRDGHVERGGKVRTLEEAAHLGAGADEWRLYARSASDDRGPILMMVAALDALAASGRRPSVNLKFFLEGEEEAGSAHLREMLTAHRDLLGADLWLFLDGPRHQTGIPQVVHGVRGVMSLRVTTFGPSRPLHSGHYGNWAPNPAADLTHVLSSMRALDGTITSVFEEVLRVPILTLPLVNYDNNQHAANEHLRLGNLWEGIEILSVIMTGLSSAQPASGR